MAKKQENKKDLNYKPLAKKEIKKNESFKAQTSTGGKPIRPIKKKK